MAPCRRQRGDATPPRRRNTRRPKPRSDHAVGATATEWCRPPRHLLTGQHPHGDPAPPPPRWSQPAPPSRHQRPVRSSQTNVSSARRCRNVSHPRPRARKSIRLVNVLASPGCQHARAPATGTRIWVVNRPASRVQPSVSPVRTPGGGGGPGARRRRPPGRQCAAAGPRRNDRGGTAGMCQHGRPSSRKIGAAPAWQTRSSRYRIAV